MRGKRDEKSKGQHPSEGENRGLTRETPLASSCRSIRLVRVPASARAPRNPPIEYYSRSLSIAAAAGTPKDIAMKAQSPLCSNHSPLFLPDGSTWPLVVSARSPFFTLSQRGNNRCSKNKKEKKIV